MDKARFFEMEPTAPLRVRLRVESRGEALVFPHAGRERFDRPHIARYVHQLTADGGGAVRVGAMQGPSPLADDEDSSGGEADKGGEGNGHTPIHRDKHHKGTDEVYTRRDNIP